MTEQEREALLQQSLYTEGIDRKRIALGFGGDVAESLFGYLGDRARFAPDPGQAARYRDLRAGLDPDEERRRAAFVEAAAGEASARQQQIVRELPSRVDPTKAAGLLQGLAGTEQQVQGARMRAETQAMKDRAAERQQRAAEMSAIEDERAEKKLGQKLARINLAGNIVGSAFKGAAALKPKTYERKLEDTARRQAKRSTRLGERIEKKDENVKDLMAKGLTQEGAQADATFDRAGQQLQRQVKLGQTQEKVDTKFGETAQELQNLRAAEAAKQREKMALQNPLPYMPRYMPRYTQ
tara:strand:+ start:7767 stop:8654 length:888 start_codon:yes stop_codon:yes gene_type:complete